MSESSLDDLLLRAAAFDPPRLNDDEYAKLRAYVDTLPRLQLTFAVMRGTDPAGRKELDREQSRRNALRFTIEYNRRLREAAPASPPRDDAPSTVGTGTRSEGGNTRPKGVPKDEAEIRVRKWLEQNAKANPFAVTRDGVADGTGVSKGMVSNTAAWKAFQERRKADAKPKGREIPLTDSMIAVIPNRDARPDKLAALIEEQKLEQQAEESRCH